MPLIIIIWQRYHLYKYLNLVFKINIETVIMFYTEESGIHFCKNKDISTSIPFKDLTVLHKTSDYPLFMFSVYKQTSNN